MGPESWVCSESYSVCADVDFILAALLFFFQLIFEFFISFCDKYFVLIQLWFKVIDVNGV